MNAVISPLKRFPFTKTKIEELPLPEKGRIRYYDTKTAGLTIYATQRAKVFYLYKKINGRPVDFKLGQFPEMTVEQARKSATAELVKYSSGADPQAEREKRRTMPTLRNLFDAWLVHAKLRKRTWQHDERMFEKYFTKWHNTRLPAITASSVASWHTQIGSDHGTYQANRCKSLLSSLYSRAEEVGYNGSNPCLKVKDFPEESRERFLLPAEMESFFKAVIALEPKWRDFFLLCILTGQRKGNIQSMQWVEIDFINSIWTIPASKSKAKKSITVPLSPPALAIVKRRYAENQAKNEPSPWVFHGRAGNHVTDPTKPWETVLTNSGIEDLHIHDLRRSLGSWQAALGSSLAIIGRSLGHNDLQSTQVYARLQLDPVRESVNAAGAAMLLAGGVVVDANSEKGNGDE